MYVKIQSPRELSSNMSGLHKLSRAGLHDTWPFRVGILFAFRAVGWGSSVGRARDSWSGGRGLDPHCGGTMPTGWVGVNIM